MAIADPVGETPVYEKDDLVPSNDQKPKFPPPKFEWNQPGFLDHLIPCKPEPSKDCTKSIIKKPETNNDLKWIHLNPHHKDEDDKQSKRLNQSDIDHQAVGERVGQLARRRLDMPAAREEAVDLVGERLPITENDSRRASSGYDPLPSHQHEQHEVGISARAVRR